LGGAGAAGFAAGQINPSAVAASKSTMQTRSQVAINSKEKPAMNQSTPDSRSTAMTVVLVHGAFADSSSWNGVIERLQAADVTVTAASNPLRGVAHDSAYVTSCLNQIEGRVLLVGHSYGGVVITNAGSVATNVAGLVYVAGLAPDEGEALGVLEGDSKDSVLVSALIPKQYPLSANGSETGTEFFIDPAKIQEAFAADLPAEQTAVMAATQRPIAETAFSEPTGIPAWKTLPTWAVVATGDKAAGTDVVRSTAERAGATIVEIDASHVVMMSQPEAVTDVILTALRAIA
jgi:pimeloyl-ACP methyl ester carboxylesterase